MTFETGVEADECLKYNGHAYDNKQITVKVSAKNLPQKCFFKQKDPKIGGPRLDVQMITVLVWFLLTLGIHLIGRKIKPRLGILNFS